MATCKECKSFFPVAEDAMDYEQGKGDCVRGIRDHLGKYFHARIVMESMDASKCSDFSAALSRVK